VPYKHWKFGAKMFISHIDIAIFVMWHFSCTCMVEGQLGPVELSQNNAWCGAVAFMAWILCCWQTLYRCTRKFLMRRRRFRVDRL